MLFESLLLGWSSSPLGSWLASSQIAYLSPELVLALTFLLVLSVSLVKSAKERSQAVVLVVSGLLLALLSLVAQAVFLFKGETTAIQSVLSGLWQADMLGLMLRSLVVILALGCVFLMKAFAKSTSAPRPEVFALLLLGTLGSMLLCGSSEMISTFVALETLGMSSILLVGVCRKEVFNLEAALKYLVFAGVSSAFLLMGFALLYGIAGGSTSFATLTQALLHLDKPSLWLPLSLLLLLAGVGFKLGLAPFHAWAPDVYEGASTPVTAFLATVSKVGGFALALRLFSPWMAASPALPVLLASAAIASIVVGNLAALKQTRLKRMLAYSSIAQVGYFMLGLVVATSESLASSVFYFASYSVITLGAFACVGWMQAKLGSDDYDALPALKGASPFVATALAVFLVALAGFPITSAFFGKLFLLKALVASDPRYVGFLLVVLLGSLISLGYYLKAAGRLLAPAEEPLLPAEGGVSAPALPASVGVMALCVGVTLLLGICASPVYELSLQAVSAILPFYLR